MFRTRSLKAHLSQIQCIDKHVDHANGVALRLGTAFAETDLDRANYETTIADLMSGQHSDPQRVVMFNPVTCRADDVSHAIAQEILRRLDLDGRSVPLELEDFIDSHVGKDRQLTLRLAS
jgi:hypothetical protein